MRRVVGLVLVVAAAVGSLGLDGRSSLALVAARPTEALAPGSPGLEARALAALAPRPTDERPLAGRVVVVDPGHQLGNHRFPGRINRLVPAGGFRKPCNTTGTATNGGYAEATFNWRVATRLTARLERLGARVILTRDSNRQDRWGPCVDARGRAGNRLPADLKISIHGDGSYAAGAHGFHVIAPSDRRPWTHDIFGSSRRLALVVRERLHAAGFPHATYVAGGDGLDFRADLATLNLSDVPTVLVELGNMRNRRDARRMTSGAGQSAYARALSLGVVRYLAR